MSKSGFDTFHLLLRAGASFLYAASTALFMKTFLIKKAHPYRKLFLAFLIHLTSWLFCSLPSIPQGTFNLILPFLFFASSAALGQEKKSSFLLALFYCNARCLSGLLAESLSFTADKIFPSNFRTPDKIYLYSAMQTLLFFLFHLAVLAVMLYVLQRQIRKRRLTLCWRELWCISLIPAAGILFGQMISRLLVEINDGTPLLLYERHPVFLGIIPLLALLFYIGSLLTIALWQESDALRMEREEYFLNLQQTRAIQDKIHETELFYARFQRLKHDTRGHLHNIKGLIQSRQYKELEQYIYRMDKTMRSLELTLQTGNAVTDVIINDKRQQCLEENIDFYTDFYYPVSGQYDAFDLGIILQNLLQNALEACKNATDGNQYISLTSKQKGKFFLIKIKNSFSGEIRFAQNGLPQTTKTKDRSLHGIGLSNVRREAEKYMGELELKTENQEFCATVLLQERSNQ